MNLLPVSEALERLLGGAHCLPAESVRIDEAADRIAAADLPALRTQPPFAASAMDGYAVRSEDLTTLPARLKVIGSAAAGHRFEGKVAAKETVRIFTGAPVPDGADAILIQENATVQDGGAIDAHESTPAGRYVRPAGLDFRQGETLIEKGQLLDSARLSLAAAANYPILPVVRKPVVAILATGDELLPPGTEPGPNQIIASNSYGVAAIASKSGAETVDLGIAADSKSALRDAVQQVKDLKADVFVTLGGASVGEHDLVQEILGEEGMALDFWKIAMRPGKPLMYGTLGPMQFLGLPGNPVSSLVCSHLFLKPLIAKLAGRADDRQFVAATLGADMPANDRREDYVRAEIRMNADGDRTALPFAVQDSSMLKTLALADGLIIRAPHAPEAKSGSQCKVLLLR